MLDSYFFIPGDKPKFLEKITDIKSDYIIIDLEDSVSSQNKNEALNLVLSLNPRENHFVRVPFFDNSYTKEQQKQIIFHFNGQIVLPKFKNESQIEDLLEITGRSIKLKMILLVENPIGFLNLPEILKKFHSQIHGVGFGSHDFCSITGMKHTLENLAHYKRQLILYTKAYNVAYIDGVDLNLNNFEQFRNECLFAFDIGAEGKFIIHPSQLYEMTTNVSFMSEEELVELKKVYDRVKDIPEEQIDVITIDGKIYEKPHISRVRFLVDKINTNFKSV